jgi:hypothetical protein
MNRPIALLICFAIAACGGARHTPSAASSGSNEGVYEFSATIPTRQPGQTLRISGTFSVVDDSLYVQHRNECYQVAPGASGLPPSTGTVATLYCGGALVTFDRRNPTSAKWVATVPVPKQRNVCAEYEPRPPTGNNPRCIRQRVESYYTYEQRTGVVQVKRIT